MRTGRHIRWTAVAVFTAVLGVSSACTAPRRVDTETAPAADFSTRHTFAWQEAAASYDPQTASADDEAVKRTIRDTVVEQLSLKGFKEVQDAPPDFLVSFHLVVTLMTEPELCVTRHLIFNYQGAPAPPTEAEVCESNRMTPAETLRQGTLVVFVVDPQTRNLLWQGAVVGADVSRSNNTESLRAAVTRMLQEFPLGPV